MRATYIRHSLLVVFILVATATSVRAHDPGLSYLNIQPQSDRLAVSLSLADTDIEPVSPSDLDHNGEISGEEFGATRAKLEEFASTAIKIEIDGVPLKATGVVASHDAVAKTFHFQFSYPVSSSSIKVTSSVLPSLSRGHRQFATFRNQSGEVIAERVFDAANNFLLVDGSRVGTNAFTRFIVLGIEHILTGFDHLAFLIALLIAGSCFKDAAKVITSFTLGHSISLALATFDVVRLPGTIVEPLIAISIMYVGIENLLRNRFERRWLLTFAFGLIHGLGFATILRELGIGTTLKGALLPLLSFNAGVEVGQIFIAGLVLPLIWKLRRNERFVVRYVPACSVLLAILGCYWLIERTLL